MSAGCEKHLVFGLIGHNKKYLTQEKFGLKVNVQGKSMQAKQRWTVEQPETGDFVFLRSHIGRYMSSDERGNVRCEAHVAGPDEKFTIEVQRDGRWAVRSVAHGYYFGGTDDTVSCFSKAVGDAELWTAQLGIHPQIHLRNTKSKRFAKLEEGELRATEDIPWGKEAMITVGFQDGKHTLQSYDGRYLRGDGQMVEDVAEQNAQFILELRSGNIVFRDCEGCYLSPVGPKQSLTSRSKTVGRNELFLLEESRAQGAFLAHSGKYVSSKQGDDLSANHSGDSVGNREIFQLEYDDGSDKWALRAAMDMYWTLTPNSGVQIAPMKKLLPEALFAVEYDDRYVAIKANNGKYITAKPSGHLYAICDSATEKARFKFRLMNRPLLVLRGQYGFVGVKSVSNKLECNCTKYSPIHLSYNDGAYRTEVKGADGKVMSLGNDGNLSSDNAQCEFTLEFHQRNKVCIRAPNGHLLRGELRGVFNATGDRVEPNTLWEY